MTCFGRGEVVDGERTWIFEVKSVNHRYCDINVRMPRLYAVLEDRIRKEVAAVFSRGHIDVILSCRGSLSSANRLELNESLAGQYQAIFEKLQRQFGYPDPPTLSLLATMKDVITEIEETEDLDRLWPVLQSALEDALGEGMAMRQREGGALKEDLLARLDGFRNIVGRIKEAAPEVVNRKAAQLRERLNNLLGDIQIEESRLAQEVALLADKVDICEELVRLESHIQQFAHFLNISEPVGRRLDFLMQEFLREINTMASKIADPAVTHLTVELKNEVEKMREQVQNLE
ncbi:MAG: YicC family protein [Deltaproteobacteria bacterium]